MLSTGDNSLLKVTLELKSLMSIKLLRELYAYKFISVIYGGYYDEDA